MADKSVGYRDGAKIFGVVGGDLPEVQGSTPLEPYHLSAADGTIVRDNQDERRYEVVGGPEGDVEVAQAPGKSNGK